MNKFDNIGFELNKEVNSLRFPGAIVGVYNGNKEVYKWVKGYKEDEIFRLASMTKPITCVAVLKAHDLGLLNIYDKISKYIPEFKDMNVGRVEKGDIVFDHKAKREITIFDIMTHQSGIGSGAVGDIELSKRTVPNNLEEAVNAYKNWYLDFDPEEKAFYSALVGLDIAARVIEITSKMEYTEFLRKYILDPLEMIDTTYKLNESQKKRLAKMYYYDSGLGKIIERPFNKPYEYSGFNGYSEGYPGGAAGLFSTYKDYSNFGLMLLSKGVYKGKRIISESLVDLLKTPQVELSKEGVDIHFNWGFGVYVRGIPKEDLVLKKGSYGWSGAYTPHFFINDEDNTLCIMMTNLDEDGGSGSKKIWILEKAYNKSMGIE